MQENLEIKARIIDAQSCENILRSLGAIYLETLKQTDTYFNLTKGRLKLREFEGGEAELIFYQREETTTQRKSQFEIFSCRESPVLKGILEHSLGIRGVVKKKRKLFMHGSTRIHLDEVDGLGSFVELETPVETSVEDASALNKFIVEQLVIKEPDFIKISYIDLLYTGSE